MTQFRSAVWALANWSKVELPEKVASSVMPHFSKIRSISKASPPMLYSPSRLILNLPGLCRVVLADHMLEDLVVGDVVAGRLADALVAFAAEGEDVDRRASPSSRAATAWTSSPIRPTGQVAKTAIALGWNRS